MLVCTECNNKEACTAEMGETKPIFCTDEKNKLIRAEFREYIPGDDLYSDPMGKPYKGFETYMQTPISNPLSVHHLSPHTAEEIRKIKEDRDRALIDTL